MRKLLTAVIAVATLLGAGVASVPAMAEGASQYRDRDHDGRGDRGERRDDRRDDRWDGRSHRGRGWERHVARCERAYRSYNRRSDSYRTRSGHWRRCTL